MLRKDNRLHHHHHSGQLVVMCKSYVLVQRLSLRSSPISSLHIAMILMNDTWQWKCLSTILLLMSFLSQDRAVYTCDEGCLLLFIVECCNDKKWFHISTQLTNYLFVVDCYNDYSNHFIFRHRLPDCWGGKSGLPDIRPGPAHYHRLIRWLWFWRLNYQRQYIADIDISEFLLSSILKSWSNFQWSGEQPTCKHSSGGAHSPYYCGRPPTIGIV